MVLVNIVQAGKEDQVWVNRFTEGYQVLEDLLPYIIQLSYFVIIKI